MATTPGKAFYERQLAYLEKNDVDGLIANQYTEDAQIISFDFQYKGREALHKHFINYMKQLGSIKLQSTDKFAETEDSIFFEATIRVTAGIAQVYDVFILRNGQATHHFTGLRSFAPNS